MIALPAGVSVHTGGRTWVKEIPEHLCPEHLKSTPPAAKPSRAQRDAERKEEAEHG